MSVKADFDIAVIGSGFAGSLMAMIARRLGRSVILVERGQHPRFVIGESSTPLANLLLEQLALRYELPALRPLVKWGSWQQQRREIACGLKRGFSFFHHRWNDEFRDTCERSHQLLVAASPHDAIADTHWYRPDFDFFLVQQAQETGVEYFDQTVLEGPEFSNGTARFRGQRMNQSIEFSARFVVDATGPRGYLNRALRLGEHALSPMPGTQALFSHFRHVTRWDTLFPSDESPPYPIDDAAVHHVFDGGWIWVLRFNNGITSAGIAATDALAARLDLGEGARAWERVLAALPSLRKQFAVAISALPFVHLRRLSFASDRVSGPHWALLPSSAGFIDPLLSTGFPLVLLGISRLAKLLEMGGSNSDLSNGLLAYEQKTKAELQCAAQLIAALYANLNNFELFVPLTLLYFAAASYSETAHRLNRPELATSFLLHDHPKFGPRLCQCTRRALAASPGAAEQKELIQEIYRAVDLIDIAGFGKRERRNWHPVRSEDLFEAAQKLGADRPAITAMLTQCGFDIGESRI